MVFGIALPHTTECFCCLTLCKYNMLLQVNGICDCGAFWMAANVVLSASFPVNVVLLVVELCVVVAVMCVIEDTSVDVADSNST